MQRTLLTLNEHQWRSIEDRSRVLQPGHAILEFWREALGLTMDEWDRLPRASFNVMDYEVSEADYERLTAILNVRCRSKRDRMAVSMILLDKGPAVAAG